MPSPTPQPKNRVYVSHPQRNVPSATPSSTFLWWHFAQRFLDSGMGVHASATAFSFECIAQPAHRSNNLFLTSPRTNREAKKVDCTASTQAAQNHAPKGGSRAFPPSAGGAVGNRKAKHKLRS